MGKIENSLCGFRSSLDGKMKMKFLGKMTDHQNLAGLSLQEVSLKSGIGKHQHAEMASPVHRA